MTRLNLIHLSAKPKPEAAPVLSIVVPIYDEEAVIDACFARICRTLTATGPGFEIICVNHGSRDRTQAMLAEANTRQCR